VASFRCVTATYADISLPALGSTCSKSHLYGTSPSSSPTTSAIPRGHELMEHPAARRFFMRYRIRPAMSDLREPIYESHHLHFQPTLTRKELQASTLQ